MIAIEGSAYADIGNQAVKLKLSRKTAGFDLCALCFYGTFDIIMWFGIFAEATLANKADLQTCCRPFILSLLITEKHLSH